ncbi:sulfur carrier protein ThiS [Cellulophaga baltica]|uniref:sulfur carrier protein ThiS n=1 Tax=Cellulophaga TaxID=104264 RepID=UPI001C06743E|nr:MULTISPECIES: sulfur carrier protein ThiS [Cellulophaga]MBU2996550.1 sulfur carrier protein ThiS [Cellulophaga baltica]MDO6767944.1 sulfur carrier protein ThiS [Cellulophaga sp. 1_MG-2023]
MISIVVNEKQMHIEEKTTVLQLLEKVKSSKKGIALAINNEVILKDVWDTHLISNNDTVLIIQASQGG